jgi:hypothetical protein
MVAIQVLNKKKESAGKFLPVFLAKSVYHRTNIGRMALFPEEVSDRLTQLGRKYIERFEDGMDIVAKDPTDNELDVFPV